MFSDSLQEYLNAVNIPLRLSCANLGGWPIVLSLWYVYRDGDLYCATQANAQVVAYLKQNPACGFEVASDLPPYCGIRGRAIAEIVPDKGVEILNILLNRYLGGTENKLAEMLIKNAESEVAIRLKPVSVSSWNFSKRMEPFASEGAPKPCP